MSKDQCDQMPTLFVQYLGIKEHQRKFGRWYFLATLLNPRKVAEDLLNFAKSGHTAKDRGINVT